MDSGEGYSDSVLTLTFYKGAKLDIESLLISLSRLGLTVNDDTGYHSKDGKRQIFIGKGN